MPIPYRDRAAPPTPCPANIKTTPADLSTASLARHRLDINDHELDAVLAGLRLLAREVKAGNMQFTYDNDIACIWTNEGEHDGLEPQALHDLATRLKE